MSSSASSREELTFLGITSSPPFGRAPKGNGCAERIIRTLEGAAAAWATAGSPPT